MMKVMNNAIKTKIIEKINPLYSFQPILFLWENLEILHQYIYELVDDIFRKYNIDKYNLHILKDNEEKIKINDMRDFLSKTNLKSNFPFQIFVIENISRASIESFNAALKTLEEPGIGNIFFLTNSSEAGIPDTILSRVQNISLNIPKNSSQKNTFFLQMIDDYATQKNVQLLSYFFQDKKIEKSEYITFLYSLIQYIHTSWKYISLIDDIYKSIHVIEKNNVLAKYEIDTLLFKL